MAWAFWSLGPEGARENDVEPFVNSLRDEAKLDSDSNVEFDPPICFNLRF